MTDIVPATVPPTNGNENRQPIIITFIVWVILLADIFVVLRVIVRTRIVKTRLWWDDIFIILAALSITIIGLPLNLVKTHYGFGRHQYYLEYWQIFYYTAWVYAEWTQTFFTLMCTKVSICLFLLRIPVHKRYIFPLRAAIVILILSNVVLTLLWIFRSWPIPSIWDDRLQPKYSFSHQVTLNIILAQALISLISDYTLALYPILILWHLKLRLKDKVGLCLLMGVGVLTGACCTVRTVLNQESMADDATYGGITNWFWRLFEVQFGIICACIPTLIPGYKWVKHRMYGGTKASDQPSPFQHSGPHKRKEGDITELLRSAQQTDQNETIGGNTLVTSQDLPRHSSSGELLEKGDVESQTGRIRKTTRVDVEHTENVGHHASAPDHNNGNEFAEPKASLDVDLRPSFEDNRPVFDEILHAKKRAVEDRV